MPSTTSDTAGLILTEVSVGFYDLTRLQGNWGRITKFVSRSDITHVGLVLNFQKRLTITLHPGGGAKLHREDVFEDWRIDELPVGERLVDLDQLVDYSENYCDTSVLDAIFYNFAGRYIGLTRPRVCTTLVCSLLGLPEFWRPADLYRYMKGNQ